MSVDVGAHLTSREPHPDETAHRERLQRALGESYALGRLLGRGGFAEVYAAQDVRLGRDVAVKTLRFDVHSTSLLLDRFQREAATMAKLRHPNILPIYLVGEGEGLAYFIMPLITGSTLREAIEREQRFSLSETRRVLFEAAGALHHAHQAGTVHRDIKPDNIILEGADRRVWVMDFGIAKALEGSDTELTGSGVIVGTPQYMSPEQASGDPLDHRSDLYSLGVVGFQMITGELPFTASSPQGIILKPITEEAPRVEERRPECPGDLADVIARCLVKEPEDRWDSAETVCSALRSARMEAAAEPSLGPAALALPAVEERPATQPVRRFRFQLGLFLIVNAALFALDLGLNGAVDFAPVLMVLLAVPLLSRYASLWMDGYGWRDVLLGARGAGSGSSGPSGSSGVVWSGPGMQPSSDSGAFGTHLALVDQVRGERAVVVGLVTRMPKAERRVITRAVPAADGLVAQARSLARQLTRVDRVIEETRARDASSTGGARTPEEVREAESRRDEIARQLEATRDAMHSLRVALERCHALGVAGARTDLDVAVANAEARTRAESGETG